MGFPGEFGGGRTTHTLPPVLGVGDGVKRGWGDATAPCTSTSPSWGVWVELGLGERCLEGGPHRNVTPPCHHRQLVPVAPGR